MSSGISRNLITRALPSRAPHHSFNSHKHVRPVALQGDSVQAEQGRPAHDPRLDLATIAASIKNCLLDDAGLAHRTDRRPPEACAMTPGGRATLERAYAASNADSRQKALDLNDSMAMLNQLVTRLERADGVPSLDDLLALDAMTAQASLHGYAPGNAATDALDDLIELRMQAAARHDKLSQPALPSYIVA